MVCGMRFTWDEDKIRWYAAALEAGDYPRVFMPLLQGMLDFHSTVLEVGAGIGPFALMLAAKVQRVTALEPCGLALEHLRTTAQARGIANMECVESTWEDWPGEPHDAIIASYVGKRVAADEASLLKMNSLARRAVVLVGPVEAVKRDFGIDVLLASLGRESAARGGTAGDSRRALERLGIPFSSRTYTYEFGQPFSSLDEAVTFFARHFQLTPHELDRTRSFLEKRLVPRDQGYYLPGTRTSDVVYWHKTDTEHHN